MTIYAALPFVRRTGMYSVRLPNLYNVSFDYYYCLIAIMLSYIPCKNICFLCTRKKRYSDKCRFFVCFFASVSSALLPHAAAEKKGASRGGHRGEGRVNRLPPLAFCLSRPRLHAAITSHTSSSSSFLEQDKRSFTVSEWEHWKHVHRFLCCRSWRRRLVIMAYLFFSPASLHLFTSEEQLFISPELTPS